VNESAAGNNGQVGDPAGPYRVLDTATRRQAAIVYLVVAAFAVGLIAVSGVGAMWITAVAPLMMLAALQVAGGWRMRVRDIEAIRIASEDGSRRSATHRDTPDTIRVAFNVYISGPRET
jgi:hypothetical protein